MSQDLRFLVSNKDNKISGLSFDDFSTVLTPPGAPGPVGAQGPTGSSTIGMTGSIGDTGFNGPIGPTGPPGSDTLGPQGPPGDIGPQGATGGSATTYLALTDTPNNFTDTNNAITVNGSGTATSHNNVRARINNGNNPSGTYSISLNSFGSSIVSGNYGVNSGSGNNTFILSRPNSGATPTSNRSFHSYGPITTNNSIIWNSQNGNFIADRTNAIISSRKAISIGGSGLSTDSSTVKYNVGLISRGGTDFNNSTRYCGVFEYGGVIGSNSACNFCCQLNTTPSIDDAKYVFARTTSGGSLRTIGGSYQHFMTSSISSSVNTQKGNFNTWINCGHTTNSIYGNYCFVLNGSFSARDNLVNYCSAIDSSFGVSINDIREVKFCGGFNTNQLSFTTGSSYCYVGSAGSSITGEGIIINNSHFSAIIASSDSIMEGARYSAIVGCDDRSGIGIDDGTGATYCVMIGSHYGDINYNSSNCAIINSRGTTTTVNPIINATGPNLVNQSALISIRDGTANGNNVVIMGRGTTTPLISSTDESLTVDTLIYNTLNDMISDERLKKDIVRLQPDPNILDKVSKISTFKYKFKKDHSKMPDRIGFISQDIEKQFPEVTDQNNFKKAKALKVNKIWTDAVTKVELTELELKTLQIDSQDSNKGTYLYRADPDWLGIKNDQILLVAWEALQVLIQKNKNLTSLISKIKDKQAK